MPDERTPLLNGDVSVADAITRNPGVSASVAITTPAVSPPEQIPGASVDAERDANVEREPASGHAGRGADDDTPVVSDVKLAWILPGLMIGVCLAAMDATIVVSSYGRIGSSFQSLEKTSWVATAYLMTTTSFQPLYGKLSDLYGRKACLLFAYTVFAIGSAGCGLARSMNELIIWRAIAGIGGGGMTTVVSILMSDIIPLRKRGAWQGYINLVYATGSASGAPLGGILADLGRDGWRWAFLFQVPLTMLAALCVFAFLQLPPRPHIGRRWHKIDFGGAIILVSSVLCILVGLEYAGTSLTRVTSRMVMFLTLPLGLMLFVVFWFVEAKIAIEPFAPMRIVADKSLLASYICNLLQFGSLFSIMFYVPLYFQAVAGLNAKSSGSRLIPAIVGSVTGSVSGGLIMQNTGRYYWLTVSAYVFLFLATIPIILGTGVFGHRSFAAIECGLAVNGFGGGVGVTSTLIAMIARAGPEDQAIATAVSYLFRSLGSVLGVSISSFILQIVLRSTLRKELRGRVEEGDIDGYVRKATESLDFLKTLPDNIKEVIVNSYEKSVRFPFLFSAALAILCIICSLFIKEEKLRK